MVGEIFDWEIRSDDPRRSRVEEHWGKFAQSILGKRKYGSSLETGMFYIQGKNSKGEKDFTPSISYMVAGYDDDGRRYLDVTSASGTKHVVYVSEIKKEFLEGLRKPYCRLLKYEAQEAERRHERERYGC